MIPEPDPHQGRGLITSVNIFFLFNKTFIFKDAVEFSYQTSRKGKGGKGREEGKEGREGVSFSLV